MPYLNAPLQSLTFMEMLTEKSTGRSTKQNWESKLMAVMYDKLKFLTSPEGMHVPTYRT